MLKRGMRIKYKTAPIVKRIFQKAPPEKRSLEIGEAIGMSSPVFFLFFFFEIMET